MLYLECYFKLIHIKFYSLAMEKRLFSWMVKIENELKEQQKLLAAIYSKLQDKDLLEDDGFDLSFLPNKNEDDILQWEKYLENSLNFKAAVSFAF